MRKPKLTLYFDLHSPYSYLAFYVIKNSAIFRACEVTYTPVLLVAYINAVGLKPPWSSPNKVNWIQTDVGRWCQDCGIPWKQGWPANYPFEATTMEVQRALISCSLECPERFPEVVAVLYHAFWYEKKGVQLPEIHGPLIAKVVGAELAAKIRGRTATDEVKSLLRQHTDSALSGGSPGLPWIKATDLEGREQSFWGFDHLGQVARFLRLGRLNEAHL
ncbi:hypothetical protein G647_06583 [Cladophialophora carrionii CBS 160.54]|uniref:Glutathione S-transferase kappa n=1 Tax=Cladophialophora carrionii CBS 160.54 TaxID=1279043 RepID=V9D883_9EURO|nr:uncharacterized protein G647_06583 [Cladophialophora carrionii CBS 160.54]ETI22508.1 hypothetical protein G647_06583 [Cladophialophora carrionii CBS 160.54]